MSREVTVPEITNTDNGERGTGAEWDFTSLMPQGKLLPTGHSEPKTLRFTLSNWYAAGTGRTFKFGLLNFDARVFGQTTREQRSGN